MRKFFTFLVSFTLITAWSFTLPSTHALAATSLITCTDLSNQKMIALKGAEKNCKSFLAPALWYIQQSDSSAHNGTGYSTLRTCSSKNLSFTYQFFKKSCPKFQSSTDYWRTTSSPQVPVITTADARSYNRVVLTLAPIIETEDAPIAYYLVMNIKTGQVSKTAPNSSSQLIISDLSALTSYTFQIAAVSVDGTSAFSPITPTVVTKAVPIVRVEPVTVPLVAVTAVYAVGDRGLGGGIVYYVSPSTFESPGSRCNTSGSGGTSSCKYLEVAPATWQSAGVSVAEDSMYVWSTDRAITTGQDSVTIGAESGFDSEKFNWKIGQGFYNTSVMKVAGAASEAQAAVLAYGATDASAGQWFLPSMHELNELCKYARGQVTGVLTVACDNSGTLKTGTANDLAGFVANIYWSSSEYYSINAWFRFFSSGTQISTTKDHSHYIRPVRAM